ncbi:DUF2061 domain-containing protein [Kordiimonas pumila]|uniref:DUF2061 domain-containing protein n=1 Tax=Kordiimonas pumila TaxID=2161677 RepID=A0ABV7D4G9_9PROT|nr:DUF2061 domain-containing protein [Kordiimonas pumila]
MKALKIITYGLMHLSVAITVAYMLTGSWMAALSVGIIEPLVQTGFYSLHEKLWARLELRRAPQPVTPGGFTLAATTV